MGVLLVVWLLIQAPVQRGGTAPVAEERFRAALRDRASGNHEAARRGLQQAWEMGYRDAYVLYSLIEEDRALGDKPAGMRHFQLLTNQFPDSPWLHVLYADAYMAKDQQSDARKEYEEALRLSPILPTVAFRVGYIHFSNGDYDKAEAYFRRELRVNPSYSDANLFLGETLRQLGRVEAAIPYYRTAVALDSKLELAYRALASALTDEGDLSGALEVLANAGTRFPEDPSFPAQLARIFTRLHRDEEALRQQARFKTLMEQQRRREKGVEMRQ